MSNYHHTKTRKHSNFDVEDDIVIKKPRSDVAEIEKRLESLITLVGDKTSTSYEKKLEGLARVLDADFNLYKTKITNIICHCVVKYTEKISIYTTLVGLMNVKNNDAGSEIVEHFVKKLKENLKKCNFEASLNIVNFLADLVNVNVLPLSSLTNLFENFLEVTQEESSPQARKDWFVYAILSCLPYMGKEFKIKKEHDLKKMMSKIELYMSKRKKFYSSLLEVWTPHKTIPSQPEYLENLWVIIKNMFNAPPPNPATCIEEIKDEIADGKEEEDEEEAASKKELNLYNPYFTPNVPVYMAFENDLSQSLHHSLPTIIPPIHNPSNIYPLPMIAFSLFEKLDIPEGYNWPAVDTIDKWYIEKDIHSIIHANYMDRKACAAQLLQYRIKGKIPLNYMIVECMFAQLFNLPSSHHIEAMYAALFIELCKLQPNSLPPVLAQATEIIFERLDYMNIVSADRFMVWFAHHISNFQYKWSWEDWESCLEQDTDMPQPKFITETLVKCIRLSYYQRISDQLPEIFRILLPPKTEPTYRFEFEMSEEEALGRPINELQIMAKTITESLKRKEDSTKLEELLRCETILPDNLKQTFQNYQSVIFTEKSDSSNYLENLFACDVNEDEEGAGDSIHLFGKHTPLKIAIFIQTVLHYGNRSFSHSFSAIAKYFSLLKQISDVEDYQYILLRSIYDYWKHNSQFVTILVDKMIKTRLMNPKIVCNWVFSQEMAQEFTKSYVWNELVIRSCLDRLSKRINTFEEELKVVKRLENYDTNGKNSLVEMEIDEEEPDFNSERLSPEEIESLREKLDAAKNEQKQMFLIIFQRFIIVLSEYLVKCDNDGMSYDAPWFKYTIGRLEQIFLKYYDQILSLDIRNPLETLLFTSDIDDRITIVYKKICSLLH